MPTRISGFVIDSFGNAVNAATVTPKASDGTSGATGVTDTAGFFAIAGLADKVWTGTVTSSLWRVHSAAETFQSDDVHNQSNTLSAHDFSQLRGKLVAPQVNSQAAAVSTLLTADGAGNATWAAIGAHVHAASDVTSGEFATARIAAKFRTIAKTYFDKAPVLDDVWKLVRLPDAATVIMAAYQTGSGTFSFNVEARAKDTWRTVAGTKLWTVDKTVSSTHAEVSTFDNAAVVADKVLVVTITAASSPVDASVDLELTID